MRFLKAIESIQEKMARKIKESVKRFSFYLSSINHSKIDFHFSTNNSE